MTRIKTEKKKKEKILNQINKNMIVEKMNIKKKKKKRIEILTIKKKIQKIEIIYQIINRKRKINIKKKNEVGTKNMKETKREKEDQRIENIITIDIQDILMINIKIENVDIEIKGIIITEVINIQNIKNQNLDIVLLLNLIK